ncbi:MAG: thioredoxin fold domain-containing protein [bacterium]|nr:thioredoxin fold domain-containing protein [bacterium]
MKIFKLISILILLSVVSAFAQFGVQKDLVKIKTFQSFDKVYPGTEFKIAIQTDVDEGWHINSDKPYDEYLIPTSLIIPENPNFKLVKIAYPKPHDFKFSFSESPLSVWEGSVFIGALIEVDSATAPGTYSLIVELEYQACNDISCQAPTAVSDTLTIEVADKTSPVNSINDEIFSEINLSLSQTSTVEKEESDPISSALENQGLIIGLLLVFLGGLALNLTPCVYPLIPITVGYFGGQSEGSTTKLFFMGILFILGLAVTYSAIGVITSLTGAVFGALLQNPIVILIIVAIMLALSLSMFGVYEFKLPDSLVNKAGGAKAGLYGAFFMGLTMGIVAAPCIGPFVLGLVTYVATKQDPFFGFLLFFVLAVGLGTPYLFLAVFSGKIKNLPRAGEWMDAVKHIFGFILIGMALYFLLPLLPKSISGYVLPVFMIGTAIYLLFFEKLANSVKGFRIFKIVFSVLIMAIGVYALVPSETKSVDWQPFTEDALNEISGRGVIIDFYADWCIPCKELDALTFSDPQVISLSKEFETYKADMTKALSPEVESLRERFKIVGVPTVLILNSKGEEVERITGFVNANEFYKKIENVN